MYRNKTRRPVLALACLDEHVWPSALLLAARLNVPCIALERAVWRECTAYPLLLLLDAEGLSLASTSTQRMTPVRVDFSDPALLRRVREKDARRQDLARAVGVDQRRGLGVVDATAGWGRDSALLAALGCEITMIERHPIVVAMLEDALHRGQQAPREEVRSWVGRMRLVGADAVEVLRNASSPTPDVILLDPMFPERGKQAAVRIEMQMFHSLVGDDADAPRLLEAALDSAHHRVVVKRPRKAPALEGRKPAHSIEGRSTRFDIYPLRKLR